MVGGSVPQRVDVADDAECPVPSELGSASRCVKAASGESGPKPVSPELLVIAVPEQGPFAGLSAGFK